MSCKGGAVAAALADDAAAAADAGRPLSRAAAAQRAGAGGARSRQRGDGCVRRAGRRSRQALRGVRRVGRRSTRRAFRCRRRPRRCWRAARSASRRIVAGGDDYEILCAIPENRFEAFAQAAAAAGVAVTAIGTVIAGRGGAAVSRRAGQGDCAAAPVLQPFLRVSAETAAAFATLNTCRKSTVLALRGVAPGMRFWHGPADLRPPFWAGQASFLCARRSRGDGVGSDQDLRQIQ